MSSTAASGFVFLLLFVQVIQSQDTWGVIYTSTDVCAVIGSRVEIICRYTYPSRIKDHDIKKTIWFTKEKDGQTVDLMSDSQYKGRVKNRCFEKRCTLVISDLRESDSAEYKFRFSTNKHKYTGSPGVTLGVTDSDLQVLVSKLDSTSVDLKCLSGTDQHDDLTYIWYRNGEKIETGSSLSVSFGSSDSYSCAIQGQEELCSPSVLAPKFLSGSVNPPTELVEGTSVTLTCSSDANPTASYLWYKADQPLLSKGRKLVFSSIESSDSGEYNCEAQNQMGKSRSELISIDVKYAPKLLSVLVSPPDEIVEGNSVNLTCSSDANPAASHIWYKGKKKLLQGPEGVYRFTSISSEDRGIYYCKSKNPHGEVMSSSLSLDVQYPPKRPSVSVSPSEIVKGSSVTMTCSSDANPLANYTWYKVDEDSPKASGRIFTITNFTDEHSGNYSCEAQNTIGRSNSTFHLSLSADRYTIMMFLENTRWTLLAVVPLYVLTSCLLMRKKKAIISTTEPDEPINELDDHSLSEDMSDEEEDSDEHETSYEDAVTSEGDSLDGN